MVIKIIAGFYALGLFMGGIGATAIHDLSQPNCPEEDSCTVDYYDGEWHINEDRP